MKYALIISTALSLSACISATPISPRPSHWGHELKSDANFYKISDHLYRSEQPILDDVPAIHAQNIKTIINLRQGKDNDDERLFTDIRLIRQPLITWRVSAFDVAKVLYDIEKYQKDGAVLIHCRHGADRTGIVIAMYRVIYEGMDIEEARREMKHGDYGYHLIWKNLDNLLSPAGVASVKGELLRLKTQNPL